MCCAVTITDPLTGSSPASTREFQSFRSKDQQKFKTFSSEDAPVSIGVILILREHEQQIERAREAVDRNSSRPLIRRTIFHDRLRR